VIGPVQRWRFSFREVDFGGNHISGKMAFIPARGSPRCCVELDQMCAEKTSRFSLHPLYEWLGWAQPRSPNKRRTAIQKLAEGSKIRLEHVEGAADVFVGQSSMRQVRRYDESNSQAI
jgi:hypothetical protein